MKNSTFLFVLYVLFFGGLSIVSIFHPKENFDALGYFAAMERTTDPIDIHRIAYAAVPKTDAYVNSNEYKRDLAANPWHFAEQIPFYSVKPLYVEILVLGHALGVPLARTPVAVSAISMFLLGLLVWHWLSAYLSASAVAFVGTGIMLTPHMLELTREQRPDALAVLLISTGIYLILEKNSGFWGCAAIVLTVWGRPETIILCGILLLLAFWRDWLDRVEFGVLSALAVGSYCFITHYAGSYGWSIFFYHSLVKPLTSPSTAVIHVSPSLYLSQLIFQSYLFCVMTGLAVYVLLGFVAIRLSPFAKHRDVVIALFAARITTFILYPNPDWRYGAALSVIIPVCLARALASKGELFGRKLMLTGASAPEQGVAL